MNVINHRYDAAVPVSELRKHPKNPRRGDINSIRDSITHNGFYGAAVVQQSTGYILAGNHRYEAAIAEGALNVPVLFVDCDDQTAARILLADNRTSDIAGYIQRDLIAVLQEVAATETGLSGTGYDEAALAELLADSADNKTKGADSKADIPFTEELHEEHNYVVFYFDRAPDWQAATETFHITPRQGLQSNEKNRRVGIGRLLKGAPLLRSLQALEELAGCPIADAERLLRERRTAPPTSDITARKGFGVIEGGRPS